MGHSVLSQGIVMSVSPSIRLSEVLSPSQQRISAALQSLPSQPCSCGFSTVEPEVIGRLVPARGNLFNFEWGALGYVKFKLATQVKQALHLFSVLFHSCTLFQLNGKWAAFIYTILVSLTGNSVILWLTFNHLKSWKLHCRYHAPCGWY